MSRPLRIQYEGAWYHVMNRGAGRRRIFRSEAHRIDFLSLLQEISKTFKFQIHAYCLLDTHYHLLVSTPQGNLSQGIRHLNGVYTQRYNRSQHTDGPLFRGRFKAIIVDADQYLLQLSRYIHLNPVEAGLKKRLEAYRWSSYRAYIGQDRPPNWLCLQETLEAIGERNPRERYQAFVESGVDQEMKVFYSQGRRNPILGDDRFRRRLKRRSEGRHLSAEVPKAEQRIVTPSMDQVVENTARVFGVPVKELFRDARGRGKGNLPRAVAIMLSREAGGYPLKIIAKRFKMSHYSSVSVGIRRLKERLGKDHAAAIKVRRIEQRLEGD